MPKVPKRTTVDMATARGIATFAEEICNGEVYALVPLPSCDRLCLLFKTKAAFEVFRQAVPGQYDDQDEEVPKVEICPCCLDEVYDALEALYVSVPT